jgi:hypothetical protein
MQKTEVALVKNYEGEGIDILQKYTIIFDYLKRSHNLAGLLLEQWKIEEGKSEEDPEDNELYLIKWHSCIGPFEAKLPEYSPVTSITSSLSDISLRISSVSSWSVTK